MKPASILDGSRKTPYLTLLMQRKSLIRKNPDETSSVLKPILKNHTERPPNQGISLNALHREAKVLLSFSKTPSSTSQLTKVFKRHKNSTRSRTSTGRAKFAEKRIKIELAPLDTKFLKTTTTTKTSTAEKLLWGRDRKKSFTPVQQTPLATMINYLSNIKAEKAKLRKIRMDNIENQPHFYYKATPTVNPIPLMEDTTDLRSELFPLVHGKNKILKTVKVQAGPTFKVFPTQVLECETEESTYKYYQTANNKRKCTNLCMEGIKKGKEEPPASPLKPWSITDSPARIDIIY